MKTAMKKFRPGVAAALFLTLAGCTSSGTYMVGQPLRVTNNGVLPITNDDTAYYGHNSEEFTNGIIHGAVDAANDFMERRDGLVDTRRDAFGIGYNRGYQCMQGQTLKNTAASGDWSLKNYMTYDQWSQALVRAILPAFVYCTGHDVHRLHQITRKVNPFFRKPYRPAMENPRYYIKPTSQSTGTDRFNMGGGF